MAVGLMLTIEISVCFEMGKENGRHNCYPNLVFSCRRDLTEVEPRRSEVLVAIQSHIQRSKLLSVDRG
jgi:hypothetical protein